MAIETRLFINNEFVNAKTGKTFKVINPATEEVVAEVQEAGAEDVDIAVDAAEKALPAWSATSAQYKADLIHKLVARLEDPKVIADLGALEGASMGIPSAVYPQYAAALTGSLKTAAAATVFKRGHSSLNTPGFVNVTFKVPVGVVAAVLPWNVPLSMFGFKVGPAIAAGNTIVVKTSEKTPLTALYVANLIKEVGFPPGVVNILSGFGQPCGEALARHMKVRKISFTGSARTGKAIAKAAAETNLKNVTLELGGKSPAIVFEDANIEMAARKCAFSIYRNSGQVCAAQSRVYVHSSIKDKFVDLYAKAWSSLVKHGNPADKETTQGPVADAIQFKTVMGFIEDGKKAGKVALGGNRVGNKGYFIEPTIFTDVKDSDRVVTDEIFGPVSVVLTFDTEEEVIRRANATEYGLSSSVYTTNVARAMRLAQAIEAGNVSVNQPNHVSFDMPFGGIKQSGTGKELGPDLLEPYLETKSVFICLDEK